MAVFVEFVFVVIVFGNGDTFVIERLIDIRIMYLFRYDRIVIGI